MKTDNSADLACLADTLEALRQEVARLGERVAALEKANGQASAAAAPAPARTASPPAPAAEGLSEELVLVISAAVAAFLGKKAHIRQIRLLGSAAWAHQGRATIQASHALGHA
jgi:methylmalonyl-CoA carboxyltransferase large subunit